ncbi:SMC-Scp complex subunit ScpB [Lysobacter sp. BMK333-48F3]|uniref:SMC-Scp complex subunit ScpB n=1 Tax=Lysobacter sp. BMK333-48F3 TaxID=2867962 RepID=UPI001C8C47BA|nr:SMC-Scp complex subunit ScpB [Lysobacter sp. BMK333-48F3]MBX9403396.1 SMC-Scp complex subunit ScpB [Lysobacter sp. BMK333-48F3]
MDQLLVTRIVEAALLAANQPLTLAQLHALFPEDQPPPPDSVETALQTLREGCAERGVELVEVASGFRFQVQADVHAWVARLWTERQTRYTRATLETLALIAYRQPITRGEIEQVRGVAVSSNIIKALEEREWIRVVGHRDVPGKPALFGTTKAFLDYFGLKRLDDLPPLSELKDIGELEPQLPLDGAPIAAGGIATGDGEAGAEGATGVGEAANQDQADSDDDAAAEDDAEAAPAAEAGETGAEPEHEAEGDSAEATQDPEHTVLSDDPEAAPGERAADANDHEQDQHAVETTTVPELEAESEDDRPEQEK